MVIPFKFDKWLINLVPNQKKKKNTQAVCWQKAEKLKSYKKERERDLILQKGGGEKKPLKTFNSSQNICDMAFVDILSFWEYKAPKIPRE